MATKMTTRQASQEGCLDVDVDELLIAAIHHNSNSWMCMCVSTHLTCEAALHQSHGKVVRWVI